MAANNNSGIPPPEWFFGDDPALSQKTRDGLKQLMVYVWSLRSAQVETGNQVQNLNQNISNAITVISQNVNQQIIDAGNRVIFGTHFNRAVVDPASHNGYLYVETDRDEALYGSNGVSWNLISGTSAGNFESRYTGFNAQDSGFNWIETGRNNLNSEAPLPLYRWDGNNWGFQSGAFYRTQAQLATLKGTFGTNNSNDLGATVNVTDFHHQLQWSGYSGTVNTNNTTTVLWNSGDHFDTSGNWNSQIIVIAGNEYTMFTVSNNNALLTAFNVPAGNNLAYTVALGHAFAWGPQDDLRAGEGPIAREVDPDPITGWQLYAGNNNVTYLKSDGTLGNVNLPDLTSNANVAFLQFGANSSGSSVNPPVKPIFTGDPVTGNVSGNFVGSSDPFSTGTAANGNDVTFLAGPNPVGVGGNFSGNFTGDNATGNISNNGVPPNIVRRAWFRR